MEDAKEEIRARLPIEDVVGQYIELKRAGRSLKGRSPWGVDKTPSFMVSPEKGIWHDFSANKGGDIFAFIMEVEGISFLEALEKLAGQAGVELAKYRGSNNAVTQRKRRAREAIELACKYYQFCLTKNQKVIQYVFEKRGMNKGTVTDFRIGYSPNTGRVLTDFLKKRGFKKSELEAAGLLNRFGSDMFRGRMMVPFIDTNGVIGFTARILTKGEPKYLNTPETLLFNKSRFVFGLAQAKESIRQNNYVVIVEGNMDVISSHQAGVREAVATSGTAMTELHLKTLSRLTPDVRLAYDGDEAGMKATERAIMMAGDLGVNLSVISDYHGAKDPDELIRKDPRLWKDAVKHCRPAVDYLLDKFEEKIDISTGVGKREYSDKAVGLIKYIHDAVEKKHYEQLIARKLDCSVEDLRAKKVNQPSTKHLKKVKAAPKTDQLKGIEDNLHALVLYGKVSGIEGLELPSDKQKQAELSLIFEQKYKGCDQGRLTEEAHGLFRRYQVEKNRQRRAELNEEMAAAEAAGDEKRADELAKQIAAIKIN